MNLFQMTTMKIIMAEIEELLEHARANTLLMHISVKVKGQVGLIIITRILWVNNFYN